MTDSTELLGAAFDELAALPTQRDVLAALPRLLGRLAPNGVEVRGPERAGSDLATLTLPVWRQREVVAVIAVARDACPPGEAQRLALFARAVSSLLAQVQERERAAALARLAQHLPLVMHAGAAARATLDLLWVHLRPVGAALLTYRAGQLVWNAREAVEGGRTPPRDWNADVLAEFKRGRSLFGDPLGRGGGLLPVAGRARPRRALWIDLGAGTWTPADVAFAETASRLLGTVVERLGEHERLSSLLGLQRKLLLVPAADLYVPLLAEAVRLVPGAEAGSLLVRRGDRFHYHASVGFEETELHDVTFEYASVRDKWYALDPGTWAAGVPRIISRGGILRHGIGYRLGNLPVQDTLPSAQRLAANLAVPILHENEVYALLNLDALSDPDAFGSDSIEAAQSFAVQAAVLIHEASIRARIELAARTDALTELPNRRAFGERLTACVDASRRDGTPLSLLVMDLRGFKGINDALGHSAGDEALREVARRLRASVRAEDEVFRWGGDEFAVLLRDTDREGADEAARRVTEGVGAPGPWALSANVGVASGGGVSLSGDALLREADAAMYRVKHGAGARGAAR